MLNDVQEFGYDSKMFKDIFGFDSTKNFNHETEMFREDVISLGIKSYFENVASRYEKLTGCELLEFESRVRWRLERVCRPNF